MPPERVPRNSSAENARAPHTPRVSAPPFPSGGAIVAARVSPGGRCGRISKSRRRARRQGAKALRPRCQRPAADPKADGCFEMGPRAVCQRADVWSGAAPGESAATCRLTGGSAGPGYILKGGLGTTTTPTALTRRRVAPLKGGSWACFRRAFVPTELGLGPNDVRHPRSPFRAAAAGLECWSEIEEVCGTGMERRFGPYRGGMAGHKRPSVCAVGVYGVALRSDQHKADARHDPGGCRVHSGARAESTRKGAFPIKTTKTAGRGRLDKLLEIGRVK